MNELDEALHDELLAMFRRRESDVAAPSRLPEPTRRRVRRRETRTVAATAAVLVALVAAVAIVRADERGPEPQPLSGLLPAGEPRTAVLPELSITYPGGWQLVLTGGGPQRIDGATGTFRIEQVQLTNFDPPSEFGWYDMCFSGWPGAADLPPGGVLLNIDVGNGPSGPGSPGWPTTLAPDPASKVCDGQMLSTSWSPDDGATPMSAEAMIGPQASGADLQRIEDAFASLTFPGSRSNVRGGIDTSGPTAIVDAASPGATPWSVGVFTDGPGLAVSGTQPDGAMYAIAGRATYVRAPEQYSLFAVPLSVPPGTEAGIAQDVLFGVTSRRTDAVRVTDASGETVSAHIADPPSALHATFRVFSAVVAHGPGTVEASAGGAPLWRADFEPGNATQTTQPGLIPPGDVVWSGNDTLGTRWVMIRDARRRQSIVTDTGEVLATDEGVLGRLGASATKALFTNGDQTRTVVFGSTPAAMRWVNVIPDGGKPVSAAADQGPYYVADLPGDISGWVVALDKGCAPIGTARFGGGNAAIMVSDYDGAWQCPASG